MSVAENVDLERYQGKWHEIARLPNRFEKDLDRVTANYKLLDNGKIQVINRGYIIGEDNYNEIEGIAKIPDKNQLAKIKVSFFRPFYGNYWILALDDDYQYAIIGEPKRKYLWILAREKNLNEEVYQHLLRIAYLNDYDISKIIKVNQQ